MRVMFKLKRFVDGARLFEDKPSLTNAKGLVELSDDVMDSLRSDPVNDSGSKSKL